MSDPTEVYKVGITGHQMLSQATKQNVAQAITQLLNDLNKPFVGVTSLAAGSDQIFAISVLASGGTLEIILPSDGYEETFEAEEDRANYDRLLSLADTVEQLSYSRPTEEAFLAAGIELARRSDMLIAVWDGQPAAGLGGTADVVSYAQRNGAKIAVVWPLGSSRT